MLSPAFYPSGFNKKAVSGVHFITRILHNFVFSFYTIILNQDKHFVSSIEFIVIIVVTQFQRELFQLFYIDIHVNVFW